MREINNIIIYLQSHDIVLYTGLDGVFNELFSITRNAFLLLNPETWNVCLGHRPKVLSIIYHGLKIIFNSNVPIKRNKSILNIISSSDISILERGQFSYHRTLKREKNTNYPIRVTGYWTCRRVGIKLVILLLWSGALFCGGKSTERAYNIIMHNISDNGSSAADRVSN